MGSEVGVDLGGTEGTEGMSLSKSSSFWVILAAHVFILLYQRFLSSGSTAEFHISLATV